MVLIVLAFAMAGFFFIFKLPISIFPQTDFPRIVVLVDNGITPPDIQLVTVTRPIEEAIRLVPGITTVRSVTARGSTEINVFFRWDVDILNCLHLVQGRISQISRLFQWRPVLHQPAHVLGVPDGRVQHHVSYAHPIGPLGTGLL